METLSATKLLDKLLDGNHLIEEEAKWLMTNCMEGTIAPTQMAAILGALRLNRENVEEITAFVKVMREKSTKIEASYPIVIDTCGTGGDGFGTFNISTAVALLLAAGGYKVAKHGNRSNTSKSGSADVLEALGVNIMLTPEQVSKCIDQVGVGFLFAPALHSAMKNVVPIRKELGVRTVFNILGPLTNPASANVQVVGLFQPALVPTIIRVLAELGLRSAYVVSGENGLDEVSLDGKTQVAHLDSKGNINEFLFEAQTYGFAKADIVDIKGGTPEENAEIIRKIFSGEIKDAQRDIVILNAGFALSAADDISLKEGFEKAKAILDSGTCVSLLDRLATLTQSFAAA